MLGHLVARWFWDMSVSLFLSSLCRDLFLSLSNIMIPDIGLVTDSSSWSCLHTDLPIVEDTLCLLEWRPLIRNPESSHYLHSHHLIPDVSQALDVCLEIRSAGVLRPASFHLSLENFPVKACQVMWSVSVVYFQTHLLLVVTCLPRWCPDNQGLAGLQWT